MITGEDGDQQILNAAKAVAKNRSSNTQICGCQKAATTRYCSISEPHMPRENAVAVRSLQSICQVRRLDGKHLQMDASLWRRGTTPDCNVQIRNESAQGIGFTQGSELFSSRVDRASFNRAFSAGRVGRRQIRAQRKGTRNCPES